MKKKNVILAIITITALVFAFAACGPEKSKTLASPTNLAVSDDGLISWDEVNNAESYSVSLNGTVFTQKETCYQLDDMTKEITVKVVAQAEGYEKSPAATIVMPAQNKGTLSVPANVAISYNGLITWDAVENAEKYVVTINDEPFTTAETSFLVENLDDDFYFNVKAIAKKYTQSPASSTVTVGGIGSIKVTIDGGNEIMSGKTLTLRAAVTGTYDDETVTWSITSGDEFAEIDGNGVLTAYEISSDKSVTVRATSNRNPAKYAEKTIAVVAKPALTAEMLEELSSSDKIAFEGYMSIDFYKFGKFEEFEKTVTYNVKTAMDGVNWYARYVDGSTGLYTGLYCKNNGGYASSVGVNFLNEEEYSPMLDNDGKEIPWTQSGLYNNFKNLTVGDFEFDSDEWKYKYVGNDADLPQKMIASANPYDFVASDLYLVIEENEIVGIFSHGEPDFTIAAGYKGYPALTVAVNAGDYVEVPTVAKYSHLPQYDEYYDMLRAAVSNMRSAESYKLDFQNYQYSYYTQKVSIDGFVEYVTPDHCFFTPYDVNKADEYGNLIYEYSGDDYGYKKTAEGYNSYYKEKEGKYVASRAYNADFSAAKPTFAFSEEIFRKIIVDPDDDSTVTFVVAPEMTAVASTLFYGMGNDINLYGLFAVSTDIFGNQIEDGYITNVTIKDGYISKAIFYYYFSYFYGIVEINYSDFNTVTLPQEAQNVSFETRSVPSSWTHPSLFISVPGEDSSSTADYIEIPIAEYFKTFFGDDETAAAVPFFGKPLGDTFGFALKDVHTPGGQQTSTMSITFYYDVPLDLDYTINSSIRKVEKYLDSLGYEKNAYGEYVKGDISVVIRDVDLDLNIYVWKTVKQA